VTTTPRATFVGVEIGMNRDPSAFAVAEVDQRAVEDRWETHFVVRHLEALPHGCSYPKLASRVGGVYAKLKSRGAVWRIFIDATGSGQPAVDLIHEQIPSAQMTTVYFNHGDRRTVTEDGVILGKAFLVTRLKTLLQAGRLHFPENEASSKWVEELSAFNTPRDEKANERYGAFRVGHRDELVTAVGLATQVDQPDTTSVWDLADTWGPVKDLLR